MIGAYFPTHHSFSFIQLDEVYEELSTLPPNRVALTFKAIQTATDGHGHTLTGTHTNTHATFDGRQRGPAEVQGKANEF